MNSGGDLSGLPLCLAAQLRFKISLEFELSIARPYHGLLLLQTLDVS